MMKDASTSVFAAVAMLMCANVAYANAACEPFSDAAEILPLEFLDRADPMAARVTAGLEETLLIAHIQQPEGGPFQTHYCAMGMFDMVVRFVQPVADDAVSAIVTQATYAWDAGQDPAGWVLADMQRHPMCARGPAPFASLCN